MEWTRTYLKEARADLNRLDGSTRTRVVKIIRRVSQNPLPTTEGGYGKPLGDHNDGDLDGLLKIKLKADGIRIVYKVERSEHAMRVIVIGVRADNSVYREAARRRKLHEL